METMNWIEKIKEAVHIAMNKKLVIDGTYHELLKHFFFEIEGGFEFFIYLDSNRILIHTKKGHFYDKYSITDRDELELRTLVLSIKEYNKNIAISEFEEFISDKKEDSELTINDLDSEDD